MSRSWWSRELTGKFRDPQMVCLVLDGPPAPSYGNGAAVPLADPDGTSVELPPAPAQPTTTSERKSERFARSSTPRAVLRTREEHVAITIWRSAAGLLSQTMHATTLSRWILALAIMGVGLVFLTVIPHVRGATAPIELSAAARSLGRLCSLARKVSTRRPA